MKRVIIYWFVKYYLTRRTLGFVEWCYILLLWTTRGMANGFSFKNNKTNKNINRKPNKSLNLTLSFFYNQLAYALQVHTIVFPILDWELTIFTHITQWLWTASWTPPWIAVLSHQYRPGRDFHPLSLTLLS